MQSDYFIALDITKLKAITQELQKTNRVNTIVNNYPSAKFAGVE